MTTVSVFGGTGFLGGRLVRRLAAEGAVQVAVRRSDRARSALRAVGWIESRSAAPTCATGFGRCRGRGGRRRRQCGVRLSREGRRDFRVRPRARRRRWSLGRRRLPAPLAWCSSQGSAPIPSRRRLTSAPRTRRTGRPAGVSGRDHRPPGRDVRSRRRPVRHARRHRPDAPRGAADRRRPHPPATRLCGGRGRGHLSACSLTAGLLAGPTSSPAPGCTRCASWSRSRYVSSANGALLVPVPFAVAEALAQLFERLPSPPLTTGQVDLLKADNVASGTLPGFRELDIEPKPSRRSCRLMSAGCAPRSRTNGVRTCRARESKIPALPGASSERRAAPVFTGRCRLSDSPQEQRTPCTRNQTSNRASLIN